MSYKKPSNVWSWALYLRREDLPENEVNDTTQQCPRATQEEAPVSVPFVEINKSRWKKYKRLILTIILKSINKRLIVTLPMEN